MNFSVIATPIISPLASFYAADNVGSRCGIPA
jgi:hypothetical protein